MREKLVRDVQKKILEIMKYIDYLCRTNNIEYYIMGGTALGAVRHGGFIPWDDDLDIFMTPHQYEQFKRVFEKQKSEQFVIQEWRTDLQYLEYAKVRMNGTTFIEESFKDRPAMHHGIYVDIMILHKVSKNGLLQRLVYLESKFVTLYGLSQRNWRPRTKAQSVCLRVLRVLPCKLITRIAYSHIYHYDSRTKNYCYCYWITRARFRQGLFDASFFANEVDIPFEDTLLMGSDKIKEYLECRYGDYMRLPSEEERKSAVHAMIIDTEKDYSEYLG